MNSIRAFAPATISNVNCGFDVLGFAMEGPGDEVEVTLTSTGEVRITSILPEGTPLSVDVSKNTAGVAIRSYLSSLGIVQGVDIRLKKNLPLGSGMGSSGASAAAALVAINHLMGNQLSLYELIPHAMEAERIACGSAHADNVAPSILGGFVLVRSYEPFDVVKIPTKAHLWCTLVHPQIEVRTEDSRKVLPPDVPLKSAVAQTGNIAGLMIGLTQGDPSLISRSLIDVIAEPVRKSFIPGFDEMKVEAEKMGALGTGISGSGPSVFSLCTSKELALEIGQSLQKIFRAKNVESQVFVSSIPDYGARILD